MTNIPSIKRINISSELELDTWLRKSSTQDGSVMLVTHSDASHRKHVSREQIAKVVEDHGWEAGTRYTLSSHLLAHVISRIAR